MSRLKSYLIGFTIIAAFFGGFLFDYLFIFGGIIIVVYFAYEIAVFLYKKDKTMRQDTIICPRCMVPVDKIEGKCPQCGEEL